MYRVQAYILKRNKRETKRLTVINRITADFNRKTIPL